MSHIAASMAINQIGDVHSSTKRNPLWYTANAMIPSANNQTMSANLGNRLDSYWVPMAVMTVFHGKHNSRGYDRGTDSDCGFFSRRDCTSAHGKSKNDYNELSHLHNPHVVGQVPGVVSATPGAATVAHP
jgi:hypothetical protein